MKSHFLVSFSFETQFEVQVNDSEQVFEGDIFAQHMAILQWHALDQTLGNLIPTRAYKFQFIINNFSFSCTSSYHSNSIKQLHSTLQF